MGCYTRMIKTLLENYGDITVEKYLDLERKGELLEIVMMGKKIIETVYILLSAKVSKNLE